MPNDPTGGRPSGELKMVNLQDQLLGMRGLGPLWEDGGRIPGLSSPDTMWPNPGRPNPLMATEDGASISAVKDDLLHFDGPKSVIVNTP